MSAAHMLFRRACCALLLGAGLQCWLGAPRLLGQAGVCDPSLKPPAGESPFGYRQRGERCEGIYAREVAGTTLLLVSLTKEFEDYGAAFPKFLEVAWSSPNTNPVRVRGYSLRSQLYYQMDTVRPPGTASFSWPADMLAGLNVRKPDLGVVARVSMQVGDTEREVYLPVRIGSSSPRVLGKYDVVLLSDQELSEVYLTLTELDTDGRPGRVLRRNVPLAYGFYPAQRAIHFGLPEVASRGIYLLTAAATLRSGGSYRFQFWFYDDGA
jgi:hypothetical protein